MDRYQRVEKPRAAEPSKENEIRITTQGMIRNYINYATTLLQENEGREIVLKAMGQAIGKTVTIAEIIKKRFPGLHQDASISSMKITDVWEPLEEGLDTVELHRQVSLITITLSTAELDKNSPGYQAPSTGRQPNAAYSHQQRQPLQHSSMTNFNGDSYSRGRGRGMGRGRGRGRYVNNTDNDEYYNSGHGSGRGRGYSENDENYDYDYNSGRGDGRGRGYGYHGPGYERGGRTNGGRGYGRGRGRSSRGGSYY